MPGIRIRAVVFYNRPFIGRAMFRARVLIHLPQCPDEEYPYHRKIFIAKFPS
jgi:hypothetical protein